MSFKNPSTGEAIFYNSILEAAVQDNTERVMTELIGDYYGNDSIAIVIGLADPKQIRPSFVDGPDGPIRVEYGDPDDHTHFILIEPRSGGEGTPVN